MDLTKITVDKADLIERLKANRDEHRAEYDAACSVYRDRCIAEIENMLADARSGVIRRNLTLPIPEEHTEDYDRAIDMLEWAQSDTIELTQQEFATLVRNQWGWLSSFTATTSSYIPR